MEHLSRLLIISLSFITLSAGAKSTKGGIQSKNNQLKNTPILYFNGFLYNCDKEETNWYILNTKRILASSWSNPPIHCVPYNSGPFGNKKRIAKDT